jgi:hypothetical protein
VPARPIGSLVAEDRSAEGVRDRTGPDGTGPRMVPRWGRRRAAPTG